MCLQYINKNHKICRIGTGIYKILIWVNNISNIDIISKDNPRGKILQSKNYS